jgi:hypothetical protein
VTPVEPEFLFGTIASNSSKKTILGFTANALSKTSLTAYSLAPIYLFNNSGPFLKLSGVKKKLFNI